MHYSSGTFRKLLKAQGIANSMNRKGGCRGNVVVESIFGYLLSERLHWRSHHSREEARGDIVDTSRGSTTATANTHAWATRVQNDVREMPDMA